MGVAAEFLWVVGCSGGGGGGRGGGGPGGGAGVPCGGGGGGCSVVGVVVGVPHPLVFQTS